MAFQCPLKAIQYTPVLNYKVILLVKYLDLAGIWKYENGNGSCILSLEPRTTGVIQQLGYRPTKSIL